MPAPKYSRVNNKLCKTCKYSLHFPDTPGGVVCGYYLMTKIRRGCEPTDTSCEKYEPKAGRRRAVGIRYSKKGYISNE